MTPTLEIILLVVAVIAVIVLGLDLIRGPARRRRQRAFLERLSSEEAEEEDEEGGPPPPEAQEAGASRLQRRLRGAGLPIPPILFLALTLVLGVVVFFALLNAFPGVYLAAGLLALLIMLIPYVLIGEIGRWRAWRFEEKLISAVDFLVGALRAGENPTKALSSAADVARDPVQAELKEVVSRLNAGEEIGRALARLRERYDSEGVRLFVQTLIVKWRAGGDLAPVMRSVAAIMRERVRVTLRLRSELTAVQVAAVVLAILPYLAIPFLLWQRPTWAPSLLSHPLGPTLLVIAVALQVIGFLWLRRMLRVVI
jgi:tight adherence protein B